MTTLAEFTYQPGRSIDQISGILDNRRRMDIAESQFAEDKAVREKEFAETTRRRDEEFSLKREQASREAEEHRENISLNRAKADQQLKSFEAGMISVGMSQQKQQLELDYMRKKFGVGSDYLGFLGSAGKNKESTVSNSPRDGMTDTPEETNTDTSPGVIRSIGGFTGQVGSSGEVTSFSNNKGGYIKVGVPSVVAAAEGAAAQLTAPAPVSK